VHDCWIHWGRPAALRLVTQRALEELEEAGEVERVRVGDRVVWRKARKG
jgi:hypothetical protein